VVKFQIRNPKSEIRSKLEIRKSNTAVHILVFDFSYSNFGFVSNFDIRVSNFG